jgi:hypothetical protein
VNSRIKFALIYIFSFGLIALSAETRKPLIEVRSVVDTSLITIGDRVNYSIIIDRKKGLRIEKPGQGINLGGFEIKDYNFPEPQEKDGRVIERFDYNISVYDTGKYTIPPFPVAYFPVDTSNKYKIIMAPAVEITVRSVLSGEDAPKLLDVKKPLVIPFDYWFWIWVSLGIILLSAAVYWGYYLYKKKKEQGYLFSPPPPRRPAHEIAFDDLNQLFASDLLESGLYKKFFSDLSQIFRTYLENRYFINALEETSDEILRDMKNKIAQEKLINNLRQVLTLSDLVKFAKYKPMEEEIGRAKSETMDFIIQTKEEVIEEDGAVEESEVIGDPDAVKILQKPESDNLE